MNQLTFVSIVISGALIAAGFLFARPSTPSELVVPENNVTVVDGVQIVELVAKGGYAPRTSTAQAGIPTVLRFTTNGTFDCSSIVRVPSLDITKNLPPSGSLDIDIGTPKAGTFEGSCGMGMYPFEVIFEE